MLRLILLIACVQAVGVAAFFNLLDPRAAQLAAEARVWTMRFNTMGAVGTDDCAVAAFVRTELNINDPVFTYALGCALHEPYVEKPPRNGISNIFASVVFVARVAPDKWLAWLAQYYDRLDPRARATVLGTMRYTPYAESYLVLQAALHDVNEVPMEVTNPIPYWPIRVGDIAYSWLCHKLAEHGDWPPAYDRWNVISPTHPIANRDEMFARLTAFWRTNSPGILTHLPHLLQATPPSPVLTPATLTTLLERIRTIPLVTNLPPAFY
jgi:hypothetical protein